MGARTKVVGLDVNRMTGAGMTPPRRPYYRLSEVAIARQALMQEQGRMRQRVVSWSERWPAMATWISLAMGAILCTVAAVLT
jgi:DNA-binding transcriptional regulator PaaX